MLVSATLAGRLLPRAKGLAGGSRKSTVRGEDKSEGL